MARGKSWKTIQAERVKLAGEVGEVQSKKERLAEMDAGVAELVSDDSLEKLRTDIQKLEKRLGNKKAELASRESVRRQIDELAQKGQENGVEVQVDSE